MVNESIATESIIEPGLPIVDSHHHLCWLTESSFPVLFNPPPTEDYEILRALMPVHRRRSRYLLEDFLSDVNTGHNVRATVYIQGGSMYRADGPENMKSVGEIEFANGVAAMSASGVFGDVRACAGIVGGVDLHLDEYVVEEVLRAHVHAGNGRYRGIRGGSIFGSGRYDKQFRAGFKWLHRLGLSYDAFTLEPWLPELVDLARAFPETQIILNHVGLPVGFGRYTGTRGDRFDIWRKSMRMLTACHNVAVKLGGLGMPIGGFRSFMSNPPATSEQLASEWGPYIHTCIESFGANRCMFESNFPADSLSCTYPVIWNAFKRLAAGASNEEKTALFSGTATSLYRLNI
jgi:L-fuconolactonase